MLVLAYSWAVGHCGAGVAWSTWPATTRASAVLTFIGRHRATRLAGADPNASSGRPGLPPSGAGPWSRQVRDESNRRHRGRPATSTTPQVEVAGEGRRHGPLGRRRPPSFNLRAATQPRKWTTPGTRNPPPRTSATRARSVAMLRPHFGPRPEAPSGCHGYSQRLRRRDIKACNRRCHLPATPRDQQPNIR